jgi:hypothetical protein
MLRRFVPFRGAATRTRRWKPSRPARGRWRRRWIRRAETASPERPAFRESRPRRRWRLPSKGSASRSGSGRLIPLTPRCGQRPIKVQKPTHAAGCCAQKCQQGQRAQSLIEQVAQSREHQEHSRELKSRGDVRSDRAAARRLLSGGSSGTRTTGAFPRVWPSRHLHGHGPGKRTTNVPLRGQISNPANDLAAREMMAAGVLPEDCGGGTLLGIRRLDWWGSSKQARDQNLDCCGSAAGMATISEPCTRATSRSFAITSTVPTQRLQRFLMVAR